MQPPQPWHSEEQPRQTDRVAALTERMNQDGWTVVAEMATAHDPQAYLYTVGLTTQGLPELLIEGDPRDHFALLHSLVHLLEDPQEKLDLTPGLKVIVQADKRFLVQVSQTQNRSDNLRRARYVRHFLSELKPTTLAVKVLDTNFQAWSAECTCYSSCQCCCMCEINPETGDLP